MRRTLLIVASALLVTGSIGFGLAAHLIKPPDTAAATTGAAAVGRDQGPSIGVDPGAASSGRGLTLAFSDKPVQMPSFAIKDLNGNPLTSESLKGKVVLVNFWATWCGPCREEIPTLVALQQRYSRQVVVIGLSIDTKPAADVKKFADSVGIDYPVAIAPPELAGKFGDVSAIPITYVATPKGSIITRHVGLLDPIVAEQEIRVLANLPSEAAVETVKDTGQLLLANAAFATEIPGVDLSGLSPEKKEAVLKKLNEEHCTCGCGLTVAQCRINDPSCDTSLPLAQKIAKGGQ